MNRNVSRLPEASNTVASNTKTEANAVETSTPDSFLRLVVNNPGKFRAFESLKELSTPIDRLARERVFESIVRKTIENPSHPYSALPTDTRRELVRHITELLIPSHYLTTPKRSS